MAFGGFDQQSTGAPMNEINTTPLVDVMLVLLIIFIITAPLITNSVTVDLPKTKTVAVPEKPDVINVSLDARGRLFLNDIQISEEELPVKLSEITARKKQVELYLRADRNTRYEKIADIMAAAQKAKITRLSFLSQAGK